VRYVADPILSSFARSETRRESARPGLGTSWELVMTTQTNRRQSFERVSTSRRPLRTVAVVSRNPRLGVLDAVLGAGSYDAVLIESIDHAYSQIKQSNPSVVILCVDMDDMACFQVLSMLQLDSATSDIPVITYVPEPQPGSSNDPSLEIERGTLPEPITHSMN
jgi:PleD family two-component response regulator